MQVVPQSKLNLAESGYKRLDKIKQFIVVMYYPIDLSKAVIAEEGVNEEDVRQKTQLKYSKWVIEEIKEVS
jgi:hypothetical protein